MKLTNNIFSNSIIGSSPDILSCIHLANKSIAIYARNISYFQNEIESLINNNVEFKTSGSIKDISEALNHYFNSSPQKYNNLLKDILELLVTFQKVSKSDTLRVLLATVNTNMCKRFHTDINDLRMLCTYYGPGTLWLKDENTNRTVDDSCVNIDEIIKDESRVQQISTGHVAILKGAIYPKKETKAIVHRSPTIEESGDKRLLLRIDTNEFLNFT